MAKAVAAICIAEDILTEYYGPLNKLTWIVITRGREMGMVMVMATRMEMKDHFVKIKRGDLMGNA